MHNPFIRAAWLLAAVVFLSPAARSADEAKEKPGQGPFVVLVGVSEYADKAIQPRPTADADAKAMYDLFTDPKYLGVPADRIILLTSTPDEKRKGQKATRENILQAVKDAVAKTGKDDMLVLGLFGRAAPAGDKIAFFATESTVADRAKDAVLGSDLGTELKAAKSQRLAVFFDAHFRGFDAGKETLPEPTTAALLGWVYGTSEEKEDGPPLHDKVVLMSTIPASDPLTKGPHGLFAATVIDALKGAADTEGYEPDGLVTVDELTKYLDREAATEARKIGKTAKEKEAVPFVVGEEVSHFPITRNPDVSAAADKRVKAVEALTAAGTLAKNVGEEGVALLTRMPKLKTQQELRRAYQELADGKLTTDAFLKTRGTLKESMKLPDEDAARFAVKVGEGIETLRLLYIKVLNDGELTAAAVKGLYRRVEMPVPSDIADRMKEPKTLTADQQRDLLKAARLTLGKREDLDDDKDAEIALEQMTASLDDPYTVYLSKENVKKAESQLKASFSGIGIHIRRDLARDGLLVVSPIKDSPAYKAGLKAGDLIVEVRREVDSRGKELPSEADKVVSTRGMKTDQAVELILGTEGIPVTVVVEREGEPKPLEFTIKRGRVSLETVLGVKRTAKDEWDYWLDEESRIGYIHISQFGPRTYIHLRQALEKLTEKGAKGLVLDLRFNPGGMLEAALAISDMFVDSGLLLSVRPRPGVAREERRYASPEDPRGLRTPTKFTKLPIAVLVNGQSASASEIVAACLQDYGRAVVIGERSYGKGSVQTIQRYDPTGGEFKLTTARYFPPLGRNIDRKSTPGKPEDEWGVIPNKGYEVQVSREERVDVAETLRDKELLQKLKTEQPAKTPGEDRQLKTAVEYLKEKADGKAAKK